MRKLPKAMACLLLSTQINAQVQDTTCEMIRGKCNYKFNYYTSERLSEFDTCRSRYEPSFITLNPSEVLCLHLYDEGDKQLFFRRRVTVYYRDGSKESKVFKSKSNYIYLPGEYIEKVKVGIPFAQLKPAHTDYLNPMSSR
tara:strand:- start:1121 stop:1543 length:423 start_codon:yes stop_codon:yes gene_type:complete